MSHIYHGLAFIDYVPSSVAPLSLLHWVGSHGDSSPEASFPKVMCTSEVVLKTSGKFWSLLVLYSCPWNSFRSNSHGQGCTRVQCVQDIVDCQPMPAFDEIMLETWILNVTVAGPCICTTLRLEQPCVLFVWENIMLKWWDVDFGQPEAMEYKYPFHLVQHLLLHWLYTLYLTKFYLGEKCWKHKRPDPSLWQSDKLLQFGLLAAARGKQVNRNIMHAVCMASVRRLHLYVSCVGSRKNSASYTQEYKCYL